MSPVAVPADRRFHRAHVKPARHRSEWRGVAGGIVKYACLAAAVLLAVYRGPDLIARSRLLQIDQIVVRGNQRLASDDVLAVLAGMRGENLMTTDLDAWRRRLLASPWIRDASLRRQLPATVEVTVAERQPMGIGRIGGALYLVDDRGAVIDEYGPQYGDLDLPIVDGLAVRKEGDGETDPHAALAAQLLAALRTKPAVARRVSQIDVSDLHNAAVILTGDSAMVFVGEDRFLPRLESYLELSNALREQVTNIDYVDLRFDDRIYVRPADAKRR